MFGFGGIVRRRYGSLSSVVEAPRVVVSGVQPTGSMHIGNYIGALRQWTRLQESEESRSHVLYTIVDMHALTISPRSSELRSSILHTAAALFACGIDPERSCVFRQSHVRGHADLQWILGCLTPMGWLHRMTQFKQKSASAERNMAPLGLFAYPVLMTADILLYRASHVPVGDDQVQHLELARDIARAFNTRYQTDYFPEPSAILTKSGSRVMDLRDGTKKMSKSTPSDSSRINLIDDPDTILRKMKKAKSDSLPGITFDRDQRPEVSNLLSIFASLEDVSVESIVQRYENSTMSCFKQDLADLLVSTLSPISSRMREYLDDETYLYSMLRSGEKTANAIATNTLRDVYKMIGYA